jgi:hypothetical protein
MMIGIRVDADEDYTSQRTTRGCLRFLMLDDGTYDAFIVWAEQRDNGIALQLTITTGTQRGDVVNIVTSTFATHDALSLVGLPCTLHVHDGEVRITE